MSCKLVINTWAIVVSTVVIAGCATKPEVRESVEIPSPPPSLTHTLEAGDMLGDIAVTYTGNISNWQAIASYNNIEDPTRISIGDNIEIPTELLTESALEEAGFLIAEAPNPDAGTAGTESVIEAVDGVAATTEVGDAAVVVETTETVELITETSETDLDNDVAKVEPPQSEVTSPAATTDATTAVDTTAATAPAATTTAGKASVSDVAEQPVEEATVVLSAVTPVERFVLRPMQNSETDIADGEPTVRVIGTYYPKGIYSEPATYADLLIRVAPGTLFPFENEVDGWYEIEFEDGSGFIRVSDAELINNTKASASQ